MTFEIFAVILGDSPASERMFSIIADGGTSVSSWKKSVLAARQNRLKGHDAADLTIWMLNTSIPSDEADKRVAALGQDLSGVAKKMLPAMKLSHYFSTPPTEECLHVIVELPNLPWRRAVYIQNDGVASKSKEYKGDDQLGRRRARTATAGRLVARWSHPVAAPSLPILRAHLQQPLTDAEKVPISQSNFDLLVTPYSTEAPNLALEAKDLTTLFRVSEEEDAYSIESLLRPIIERVPPTSGTGDVFHSTWDRNILDVLRMVLSTAAFIRNSNQNTSEGLKRPDYGFLVKNHCVFRGEETGPESKDDPKAELKEKLVYTYEPLGYILGYYAVGANVNFVAITRPPSTTEPLFNHNLHYKRNRVANVVHLIRLCAVISWMDQLLESRVTPEFVPFLRPDNLTRMTIGASVMKEFLHLDGADRVRKLVEVYTLLKDKRVPNVDALDNHSTKPLYPYITLTPVGMDQIPQSGHQTFKAVVCILQALKMVHSGPSPVYHRDIRRQNVLKKYDSDDWFLIDWSDATMAPTLAVTHMSESEHSPRVREDNHGAEVDIWGVGYYLEGLASRNRCVDAHKVNEMAKKWMADQTITAEVALNEISNSRHFFFTPDLTER